MEVSIIVLTFNQESTISRTLDSLLSQKTDAEFEIIIGDDNSTDSTGEICKEYQKRFPDKITYLKNPQNLGLLKNYYSCFDKAQGRYIADCSGDDFWADPYKLQKQFDYLENNPEVTLVSGEWLNKDITTGVLSVAKNMASPGIYSQKDLTDFFLNKSVIHLSASLYRKKIIEDYKIKYPEIINSGNCVFEDLQIVMACAKAGKVAVLPGVVFHYSIGHDSVSHKNKLDKQFFYSYSTLKQSYDLRNFFLKEISQDKREMVNSFFKQKGDYLSVLAFKAGSEVFEQNPTRLISKIDKTGKGSFLYFLMKNELIWRLSLKGVKLLFPKKFNYSSRSI